jgi:hypothetical protein
MSGTKIFIVLLVLIAIVFVVGIGLGATRNDNQTFQKPVWVNGLGGALAKQQPLALTDLSPTSTSCLQQERFVVPVGSPCTFAIKQSSFALRVVMLQLIQGTSATVSLAQEQSLTVQQFLPLVDPKKKDDLKVYPGKAHGMLIITCNDAGNNAPACRLEL